MPRRLALLLTLALVTGCATACAELTPKPSPPEQVALTGTWHGRVSGIAGNGMAVLTVQPDGNYAGTIFLETGDRPFHGAITVIDAHRARYQGSMGTGRVIQGERDGRRVLRFVQDGGGGGAVFTADQ
jgi:hypothetical protein